MLAANINPGTGLATDYLNHFNEVTMLLGLVADMPDMIEDVRRWRPASYEEHFLRSSFTAKALAIDAYRAAPASVRAALSAAIAALDRAILVAVADLEAHPVAQYGAVARRHEEVVRPLMGRLAGIIHGVEFDEEAAPEASQIAVDAILE
jgi:hypothetical protein